MNHVVLRRAAELAWEPVGPRLLGMSEQEANKWAYALAQKHPEQEFFVAEVISKHSIEKQVVSRPVDPPCTGTVAHLREVPNVS